MIIAGDTLPPQMDALKAGHSHAQVGQRPFEMGNRAPDVLIKYAAQGTTALQNALMDASVAVGTDAIMISSVDPKTSVDAFNWIAAQVPLFTTDSDAPDSNRIAYLGERSSLTVSAAITAGIAFVHQELNLFENLDAAANVFIGREPLWGGPLSLIDRRKLRDRATPLFARLKVDFSLDTPVSSLIGLAHGLLITKLRIQPFIVTLCGLLIYRGVARFYTGDGTAGFTFGHSFPVLERLTRGRTYGVPHSFIVMLVVAAVMWVLLHRSAFGRHLFAVGKNEEAARYSGIATDRVTIAAYVICTVLTAVSAIFFAMYTRSISPSSHGNFYELYAIAAAVLGGCSLRGGEGSIVGIVLLQVLQNLVNLLGIPSSLNFAVMGSVILIGVLADQEFTRRRELRALKHATANSQAAAG